MSVSTRELAALPAALHHKVLFAYFHHNIFHFHTDNIELSFIQNNFTSIVLSSKSWNTHTHIIHKADSALKMNISWFLHQNYIIVTFSFQSLFSACLSRLHLFLLLFLLRVTSYQQLSFISIWYQQMDKIIVPKFSRRNNWFKVTVLWSCHISQCWYHRSGEITKLLVLCFWRFWMVHFCEHQIFR